MRARSACETETGRARVRVRVCVCVAGDKAVGVCVRVEHKKKVSPDPMSVRAEPSHPPQMQLLPPEALAGTAAAQSPQPMSVAEAHELAEANTCARQPALDVPCVTNAFFRPAAATTPPRLSTPSPAR